MKSKLTPAQIRLLCRLVRHSRLAEYTWVIDKRPAEALVRRGLLERQDYRGRRGKMRRYRVSNEARTLIEIINNDGKWPAAD